MKPKTGTRGFILPEAAAVVVVCVIVAAVLAVLGTRSRSLASLGESMANLRKMHQATDSFAGDNASKFATFSWRKGSSPSSYPDLVFATSDLQAAANQAVDIIRRRAGFPTMPKLSAILAHPSYSSLVLGDYLEAELPLRWIISPEDSKRLEFARDRSQWPAAGTNARLAFSSSYEVSTSFWTAPDSGPNAVSQANSYNLWFTPAGAQYGGRRLDEVTYPANKVMYYDRHQRHFGPRQAYFMHEEARVPVVTTDGGVSVRSGADGNPGWQPGNPGDPNPTYAVYRPPMGQFVWDPPALDPSGEDLVVGRYRWTRKALFGRDVDGPEVP